MYQKFYIILFYLILVFSSAFGQKYFTVTVLDDENSQPIENALVEIELGPNKSTLSQRTNTKGFVSFNLINAQINDYTRYNFKIAAEGYYGPVLGIIVLKHPLDRIHRIKKIVETSNKVEVRPEIKAELDQNHVVIDLANISTENNEKPEIKEDLPIFPETKIMNDAADNNFVFLIDVSSSMNHPKRMPILKESLKYIVSQYRDSDFLTVITYSSKAEIILNPISASKMDTIFNVIDSLKTTGKTYGGVGLELAYKTAIENFIEKGNNKVIIATDGAFTNDKKQDKLMIEIIDNGLKNQVSLSAFAFGDIEKADAKRLRLLTQRGNGSYYHIETLDEGKKYLIKEATSQKKSEN